MLTLVGNKLPASQAGGEKKTRGMWDLALNRPNCQGGLGQAPPVPRLPVDDVHPFVACPRPSFIPHNMVGAPVGWIEETDTDKKLYFQLSCLQLTLKWLRKKIMYAVHTHTNIYLYIYREREKVRQNINNNEYGQWVFGQHTILILIAFL